MTNAEIMKLGIEQARKTMNEGIGGPFGAVVVKDGEVIAVASNSVLRDHDPTAHAEVNAIRMAGQKLGTPDLSGCELYATGYPCPMCLSAIIWANIKKVYVSGLPEDADKIGFRDAFIYEYIRKNSDDAQILNIEELERGEAVELYTEYAKMNRKIY